MPPTLFDNCCLRKGNIYSIVTVLCDLAPGVSQPSSTTLYAIDDDQWCTVCSMAACCNTWTDLCAIQTVHEKAVRRLVACLVDIDDASRTTEE